MIEPGTLDPLTKELIYIPRIHDQWLQLLHTFANRSPAKGLTLQQHAEFLAVVGMGAETNALAIALQIPVDLEFSLGLERRSSRRASRSHLLPAS